MEVIYDKETYNSVVSSKIEIQDAINDIYADFENFTQQEKYLALDIVTNLQVIIEELNKYIAVYNSISRIEQQSNEYIVSMGDTIYSIAQKETGDYNNWKQIMRFNKLTDTNLEIGSSILIPQDL